MGSTSLIKQNENEEYVLADYQGEFSADFSKCRFSPARKEEEDRKSRLKKVSEEVTGFNIVNLSNNPVRIYQGQQNVLDMEPQQCIRMTEQELSSLSLKTKGSFFSWTSICSNIENLLNISKCEIHATSIIKQNGAGKYILTDYQGEKSADFSQCDFLTKKIQSVLGDLAEEARRKRAVQEATGFNILNLSENPVRLEQNEEELRTLEFGECISMVEQDLSSLRLKAISGWFDLELDTLICSNTDEDVPQCRINTTSLIKQDENEEYMLVDYQDEFSADFRKCRFSPAKKEEEDRKFRLKTVSEEMTGFNIVNLSNKPIRFYQGQRAMLDLEPQKCIRMTEQQLLELSLRKEESSFICTNIKNSLNIYKCNITSNSLVKQNEDGKYVLTDYQGEKSADFSQCIPLSEDEEQIQKDDREEDSSEKVSEERKEEEIKAKEPDRTPPYLLHAPSESISISAKYYDKHHTLIKVEVDGLFDDTSKIENINIFLRSKNDYFSVESPSNNLCPLTWSRIDTRCLYIEPEAGQYVYYRLIRRDYSYPGDYRITEASFYDTAGNKTVYKFDNHSDRNTMYFPGTRLLVNRRTMREDLETSTLKTADGDTIVHILTTDMTVFERDISINIMNIESEEEYKYVIDISRLSSLNTHFNSPSVSGKMSLPIVIPKELSSGRYRLKWISFGNDYYVSFSESHPNNYFDHISYEEDTIAQPVVDDITMEVLKGKNKVGGDTSIKIDIPIEGLDKGKGSIDVIVRTPTGNRLSFSAPLDKGSRTVSAELNLPPHHAEGEYKITHISTTENYGDAVNHRINHRGLKLYDGGKRVHEARLLERKIKTTLKISTPPPPQEEIKH